MWPNGLWPWHLQFSCWTSALNFLTSCSTWPNRRHATARPAQYLFRLDDASTLQSSPNYLLLRWSMFLQPVSILLFNIASLFVSYAAFKFNILVIWQAHCSTAAVQVPRQRLLKLIFLCCIFFKTIFYIIVCSFNLAEKYMPYSPHVICESFFHGRRSAWMPILHVFWINSADIKVITRIKWKR